MDVDWKDPKPAQGPLAVVQGFVNTSDRMRGRDQLRTPEQAVTALVGLDIVRAGDRIDEVDRRRLVAFREALRALLVAHDGDDVDVPTAAQALDRIIGDVPMRVRFSPGGRPMLWADVEATPVDGAIGAVVGAIVAAGSEGAWRRLKACGNDACRWAFYDASRNRSGRWCDMSICGARHKMRAYRGRRRDSDGSARRA